MFTHFFFVCYVYSLRWIAVFDAYCSISRCFVRIFFHLIIIVVVVDNTCAYVEMAVMTIVSLISFFFASSRFDMFFFVCANHHSKCFAHAPTKREKEKKNYKKETKKNEMKCELRVVVRCELVIWCVQWFEYSICLMFFLFFSFILCRFTFTFIHIHIFRAFYP